jgi:hypothetical protein
MKAIKLAALVIASFIGLSQGINTPIYSDDIGHKGLYYSAGAYCAYDSLANWQCGTPCNQNGRLIRVTGILNSVRDTFSYVGYNENQKEIVVVFRGTNGADFENWITNIEAVSSPYPGVTGGRVHTGFILAYNDVKAQVANAVLALKTDYPDAKIFVTGHSLGGALAVLAAADFKNKFFSETSITLYTYGQPRVGNEAFSDFIFSQLDGSYVRVTHYDDMVAHAPPRISGFKHAGNELWFKNNVMDEVKMECPNGAKQEENGKCSNSFWLKTGIWSHTHYMGI